MTPDDGTGGLQNLLHSWPVGTQLTTRGIQITAAIADLRTAERTAEHLRALGYLERQTIGATQLWRRLGSPVAIPASPP
jgi:hypothetical protein